MAQVGLKDRDGRGRSLFRRRLNSGPTSVGPHQAPTLTYKVARSHLQPSRSLSSSRRRWESSDGHKSPICVMFVCVRYRPVAIAQVISYLLRRYLADSEQLCNRTHAKASALAASLSRYLRFQSEPEPLMLDRRQSITGRATLSDLNFKSSRAQGRLKVDGRRADGAAPSN